MTYADAFLEWLGQHGEGTSGMLASMIFKGGWDSREQEIRDLRDAIRLMIGQKFDIRWLEVSENKVDAVLETVRRLKEAERAARR